MVKMSSFPVLTRVRAEVRMSSEREVRKKRSAGKAGVSGVASEAAIVTFLSYHSQGTATERLGESITSAGWGSCENGACDFSSEIGNRKCRRNVVQRNAPRTFDARKFLDVDSKRHNGDVAVCHGVTDFAGRSETQVSIFAAPNKFT